MVRVGFLVVSAGLLVAAVHARRAAEGGEPARHRVVGTTSQRQPISFQVDDGSGRPYSLVTTIESRCLGRRQRDTWAPADEAPVEFHCDDDRLTVSERRAFPYDDGGVWRMTASLRARATAGALTGSMRLVWRYRRGAQRAACDSGPVRFETGRRAPRRPQAPRRDGAGR
jgi:hypothetical protein